MAMRGFLLLLVAAVLGASSPADAWAQGAESATRAQRVSYSNSLDGRVLFGTLAMPPGEGPFPGVVLISLAGVSDLVDHLVGLGWAVLQSERRGIATIEHLLEASFEDLAYDVQTAIEYLRARPEVDDALVGLMAQGGETMAGVLAANVPPIPAFVILVSTTGLPGDQTFRIEQNRIALNLGYNAQALEALDAYVVKLTDIVVREPSSGLRAFGVQALQSGFDIALPRNAAFPPNPEDQIRFFASTWWRALFLFRPDSALMRIRSPVLIVMGVADPIVPYEEHLPAIRRSLEAAPTDDATVCLVEGHVQHVITPELLSVFEEWLLDRHPSVGVGLEARNGANPPGGCIENRGALD